MKIHCCNTEKLLMIWILLQCLSDVTALDFVHANAPTYLSSDRRQDSDEDTKSMELNDSLDLGITNIVAIMESINSATNDHLVNKVHDDRTVYQSTSLNQLRPLNNPEYQKFGCDLHCGLRSAHSTVELKRIQSVLPDITHDLNVVVDCVPVNESSFESSPTPVRIECIAHYTGHLIHIIVTHDNFSRANERTHTPVILGDGFGEQIQRVFQTYVSNDRESITSLYVTLDLPLRSLDAADLIPFSASLKHLAITSHSLRTIDQFLLRDLHLDYFILDGCHRVQERVSLPQETRISPLPERAHRLNCIVVWSYNCPNTGDFEMLAEVKTQNRLCHPEQPHVHLKPVDINADPASQSGKMFRRRTRRSPSNTRTTYSMDFPQRFHAPGDPLPFVVDKLIHNFEEQAKSFGNDVRRDISWYQTMMSWFIGILALVILILGATLIAFAIFLRQVLRGNVKPLRATM